MLYPLTNVPYANRSHSSFLQSAPHYGLLKEPLFATICQLPDVISVDYMHTVLEGLFKDMLKFWFNNEPDNNKARHFLST